MFTTIEGIKIRYLVAGEGRPVVLLHGWGGQIESWGPVVGCLSAHFHMFALDFPGFGQSDLPPVAWGVHEYAKLVRAWMQVVGLERADLIGHSFGGRIALVLAAESPEVVGRMVLVDSAGIRPPRTLAYHARVAAYKLGKRLGRVAAPLAGALGSKDYQEAGPMRGTFVRVVNEDLRPLLPRVRASTLLIWGDQDQDTPLRDGQIMEREIPDAGLVVFQDAGHFSYLDRFPDFCRIVLTFLQGPQP